MAKILKLEDNEEIIIINKNKSGILIKCNDDRLNISEIEKTSLNENIYIKSLNNNEINCFVLCKLLENNNISALNKELDKNNKFINEILESYYDYICGKKYIDNEIKKMQFQCITYY